MSPESAMTAGHLNSHLQQIKQRAENFQRKFPLTDNFSPSLGPEDGVEVARLISRGISYYYTTKVFVKRQPHQDELGMDMSGRPVVNPYIADRLRNEAAIRRTAYRHPGARISGFMAGEWTGLSQDPSCRGWRGAPVSRRDPSILPTALEAVTAQLESSVVPQLRSLRREFMGSADPTLPVIPPRRLWEWKECRKWPSMAKDTDRYVFCHTDLDRQNILVDPATFKIVCILDWETAGFFPMDWELPYWKANGPQEKINMSNAAKDSELALFDFSGCRQ